MLVTGPAADPAGRTPDPAACAGSTWSSPGPSSLAGIALLPVWRPSTRDRAPAGVVGDAPPGITAALRELGRPGDRLFNPQPWGSWFEFALPDLPVAIDSRIEFFPAAVWDAYEDVVAGVEGWAGQLAAWGVRWSSSKPTATGLGARLRPQAGARSTGLGRIDHGGAGPVARAFVAHWSTNDAAGPSGAVTCRTGLLESGAMTDWHPTSTSSSSAAAAMSASP